MVFDQTAMRQLIKGLYAITPNIANTQTLYSKVEQALLGGATLLQYRNKLANYELSLEQARTLRVLTQKFNALFIVNDDIDLALAVDADGVHLGKTDLGENTVTQPRQYCASVGRQRPFLIGISCYDNLKGAIDAAAAGADYVAFGSFFHSSTKPHAIQPPIALIAQAKQCLAIPVVAIGGITTENAPQLIEAGADAIAVITDLFSATDIYIRSATFSRLFQAHQHDL